MRGADVKRGIGTTWKKYRERRQVNAMKERCGGMKSMSRIQNDKGKKCKEGEAWIKYDCKEIWNGRKGKLTIGGAWIAVLKTDPAGKLRGK